MEFDLNARESVAERPKEGAPDTKLHNVDHRVMCVVVLGGGGAFVLDEQRMCE